MTSQDLSLYQRLFEESKSVKAPFPRIALPNPTSYPTTNSCRELPEASLISAPPVTTQPISPKKSSFQLLRLSTSPIDYSFAGQNSQLFIMVFARSFSRCLSRPATTTFIPRAAPRAFQGGASRVPIRTFAASSSLQVVFLTPLTFWFEKFVN